MEGGEAAKLARVGEAWENRREASSGEALRDEVERLENSAAQAGSEDEEPGEADEADEGGGGEFDRIRVLDDGGFRRAVGEVELGGGCAIGARERERGEPGFGRDGWSGDWRSRVPWTMGTRSAITGSGARRV